MVRFAAHFPPERAVSLARAQALLKQLRALPRSPQIYGMVHGDLHQSNYHRADDGALMAFDFDDCEHHHYVSDVAIPLYYAAGRAAGKDGPAAKAAFAEHFLEHFLSAYLEEDTLTRAQLEQLPDWLLFRSALMTSVMESYHFEDKEHQAQALEKYHGRLERDEPVVELDFGRLARLWGR